MVMLNLFQYLFKRDAEINSEWQKDNNHKRLFTNQTVMLNLFQNLFLLDSEILLNYCFTLRSRSFYLLCKYYSLCSVLFRVSDCVLTLHKIRKFGMTLFCTVLSFILFLFFIVAYVHFVHTYTCVAWQKYIQNLLHYDNKIIKYFNKYKLKSKIPIEKFVVRYYNSLVDLMNYVIY